MWNSIISTSVVDFDQHLCACPVVYCYRLLGAYLHTWISYHDTTKQKKTFYILPIEKAETISLGEFQSKSILMQLYPEEVFITCNHCQRKKFRQIMNQQICCQVDPNLFYRQRRAPFLSFSFKFSLFSWLKTNKTLIDRNIRFYIFQYFPVSISIAHW